MAEADKADQDPTPEADIALLEVQARRARAQARLLEARRAAAAASDPKPPPGWWSNGQVTLLLLGGIVTLLGNLGVAAYNGFTSRDQEALKAANALALEREKAKAGLVLQAIASNDPQTAQRNLQFFIDAGFIPDPDGRVRQAASKYAPVLPAASPAPSRGVAPSEYGRAFWSATLDPDKIARIDAAVDKIVAARARLETVAQATDTPWYVIGVIWMLETGGSFTVHLHNGDPLTARTVSMPAGRPATGTPPFTWEESAVDAIPMMHVDHMSGLGLSGVLQAIERVNGLSYRKRGVPSPYLWSSTDIYVGGRFTGDGVLSRTAQATYPGAVALLRRLSARGYVQLPEDDSATEASEAKPSTPHP